MTTTFQADVLNTTYNGWANYETWNVALWIQNDESLYNIAMESGDYEAFVEFMLDVFGKTQTPDGVLYNDSSVNVFEINEMLQELRD